jgi:ABC-2 type transport system permease protein
MNISGFMKVLSTQFRNEFAYKIEPLTGFIGSFLTLAVFWLVWSAVYANGPATIGGIDLPTMLTYVVVSTSLMAVAASWMEFGIEHEVRSGEITFLLLKPMSYPAYHLAEHIGHTTAHLLIRVIPLLVAGFIVLGIALPAQPLAFLISAVLSFVVGFELLFLTGMWSFWTTGSIWGLSFARRTIDRLFSGSWIPLYFFPGWLAGIAQLLPFSAMYHIPLSIYIGRIGAWQGIQTQLIWIAVLGVLLAFAWKRAEQRVVVHGG